MSWRRDAVSASRRARLKTAGARQPPPSGGVDAQASVTKGERANGARSLPFDLLNLNDAYLTWMPSEWMLVNAEDLSQADTIVGTGVLTGTSRPFVLVPQTVAGQ